MLREIVECNYSCDGIDTGSRKRLSICLDADAELMKCTSLRTSDFRNLEIESVKTDSKSIILTGPNGQGKTNILEALYILSYGSSFRTSYLKECISWGKDGFYI